MSDVVAAIHQRMEMMANRIEQLDQEKMKRDDPDKLAQINFKDVEKPAKYNGVGWPLWRSNFSTFLERRDRRWPKLLDAIQRRSKDPLTEDGKVAIATEAGIFDKGTLQTDFANQLFDYLQTYTT